VPLGLTTREWRPPVARSQLAKWKLFAVWGVFLLLHFSYETFPNVAFRVIGEKGETTFFHMKMLFFAYLFVTLGEFVVRRTRLTSTQTFLYSRALIAVAYPWLTITLWFAAEALGFRLPAMPWELIYANIVTLIGIYLALRMEELFSEVEFRPSMKVLIVAVFVAALLSYVAFSFTTPMPFFVTPAEF
jgi:hypothetical protein